MAGQIADIIKIVQELEKVKGYYDDAGLDMHIAVVPHGDNTSQVVVSTKHWSRVHYITTSSTTTQCWDTLLNISKQIGRTLIKSKKGRYVYINKLNLEQTQSIFDLFKDEFGNNIDRVWEFSWDIDNSVLPEGV